MLLSALSSLAAEPVAPPQQPAPVTLEQILGGQSCPAEAAAANWCFPSIYCSVHDDCDAFCGDPAFGYCDSRSCCSCLG